MSSHFSAMSGASSRPGWVRNVFRREYTAHGQQGFFSQLKSAWKNMSLGKQQFVMFMVAESFVVAVALVMALLAPAVISEVLKERAAAELELLTITYASKVERLEAVADHLLEDPVLASPFQESYYFGNESHDSQDEALHEILLEYSNTYSVEYVSVVDLHVPAEGDGALIRGSATEGRVGQRMDAGDMLEGFTCCAAKPAQVSGTRTLAFDAYAEEDPLLFRERLSEFNPVVADHMADLEITGLVRWVVTPIFLPGETSYRYNATANADCTDDLAGMLVLGDIVNGKVPIVESATSVLTSGYAAVWYFDAAVEAMQQAISYVAFDQGGTSATLAGRKIGDEAYVRAAYDDGHDGGGGVHVKELSLLEQDYMVAAQRVGDTPVVLVRGSALAESDENVTALQTMIVQLAAATIVLDGLMFIVNKRSFIAPLEKLGKRLQKGQSKRGQKQAAVKLSDLPSKRLFYSRSAASNLVVIAAVLYMVVLLGSVLGDTKAAASESEVNVARYLYNDFFEAEDDMATFESLDNHVKETVAEWIDHHAALDWAECDAEYEDHGGVNEVRRVLKTASKAIGVELALIVDESLRVLVSANGNFNESFRCDYFDPGLLVSEVLESPKRIQSSLIMPSAEFLTMFTDADAADYHLLIDDVESDLTPEGTPNDVLLRWVAEPLYTPARTAAAEAVCGSEEQADAVLLLGSVVNGKQDIAAHLLDMYGDGYVAVYLYEEALDDFTLITSLLTFGSLVEADVGLSSTEPLLAFKSSGSGSLTRTNFEIEGRDIAAVEYAITVVEVPASVWTDEFGDREVETDFTAVLVRGSSAESVGEVKASEERIQIITYCCLGAAVMLRMYLAVMSFRPADKLINNLRRVGMFSQSGTASSSTGLSSVADTAARERQEQRHARVWRMRMVPAKWFLLVLEALVAVCATVALLSVYPVADYPLDGALDVQEYGAAYIEALGEERLHTALWYPTGEAADEEDEVYAELLVARAGVDATSSPLLVAMQHLDESRFSDDEVAFIKTVRKAIYSVRSLRLYIDNRAYDSNIETIVPYDELAAQVFELIGLSLAHEYRHDIAQTGLALLSMTDVAETVGRARDLAVLSREVGVFESVQHINEVATAAAFLVVAPEVAVREAEIAVIEHLRESAEWQHLEWMIDELMHFPDVVETPAESASAIANATALLEEVHHAILAIDEELEHAYATAAADADGDRDDRDQLVVAVVFLAAAHALVMLVTNARNVKAKTKKTAASRAAKKAKMRAAGAAGREEESAFRRLNKASNLLFQRHAFLVYMPVSLGIIAFAAYLVALAVEDHDDGAAGVDRYDGFLVALDAAAAAVSAVSVERAAGALMIATTEYDEELGAFDGEWTAEFDAAVADTDAALGTLVANLDQFHQAGLRDSIRHYVELLPEHRANVSGNVFGNDTDRLNYAYSHLNHYVGSAVRSTSGAAFDGESTRGIVALSSLVHGNDAVGERQVHVMRDVGTGGAWGDVAYGEFKDLLSRDELELLWANATLGGFFEADYDEIVYEDPASAHLMWWWMESMSEKPEVLYPSDELPLLPSTPEAWVLNHTAFLHQRDAVVEHEVAVLRRHSDAVRAELADTRDSLVALYVGGMMVPTLVAMLLYVFLRKGFVRAWNAYCLRPRKDWGKPVKETHGKAFLIRRGSYREGQSMSMSKVKEQ